MFVYWARGTHATGADLDLFSSHREVEDSSLNLSREGGRVEDAPSVVRYPLREVTNPIFSLSASFTLAHSHAPIPLMASSRDSPIENH